MPRADAHRQLAAALGESAHAATRVDAARVFVVTAAMSAGFAERLLGLRSAQRDVAVVWVDGADFDHGPDTAQDAARSGLRDPGLRWPVSARRRLGRSSSPTLRLVVASA